MSVASLFVSVGDVSDATANLLSSANGLVFASTFNTVLTVVILLFLVLVWAMRARPIKGVANYENQHFLFGNLFTTLKVMGRFHDWHTEKAKSFGEQVTYTMGLPGQPPYLQLTNPENVDYVLRKNFNNYVKGKRFSRQFHELLGDGIFNSDGEVWRKQRKLASHMFAMKVMQSDMVRVFTTHGQAVLDTLARFESNVEEKKSNDLGSASADELGHRDDVVDIQDIFFRFTMDSICELGFGTKTDTVSLYKLSDEEIAADSKLASSKDFYTFTKAFDWAQVHCSKRFTDMLFPVKRALSLGSEGVLQKKVAFVNEFAYDIMRNRRKELKKQWKSGSTESVSEELQNKYPDLLSRFLIDAKKSKKNLSDAYLKDVVLNFLIAGRDTTACLLTWMIYEVAQNPTAEEEIINEIETHMPDGKVSYQALKYLTKLEAFIYETLRLHPSVPMDLKYAIKPDRLPDGTNVPAGCAVGYGIYTMGRLKSLWGEDAEQFNLHRWITKDGTVEKVDSFKYPVFNHGLRTCLGKFMAIQEAKIMFSMLLKNYRVSLVHQPDNITYQFTVTLPVLNGLWIKLQRR